MRCPIISLSALEARCERVEQHLPAGRLVWRRLGSGPPLVLLHGGHGNWLHWARTLPALSQHFTLWLPDMPGYGESTATPQGGIDDLVDTLHQGVDQLFGAGTDVQLAGFSFGGLVAASLAARRAGTKRLVLVGPAGHGGPRRPRQTLLPWSDLDPVLNAVQWRERMRHNLLAHMLHDEASVSELAVEIHTRGALQTRFHSKRFSRSPLLAAALDRADVPVLLICGEHDVTLEPAHLQHTLCEGHAHRTAHTLPGVGHWAMFEDPAAVSALMVPWLKAD
ncbi:alpha/beta fold hydrolase [Hydrogenophaga sp.]|uniref:alpha/beta fold hydrolase n=1 Tax=Hydrogenophaga sp. TaxID=1904254 RepID=UPI002FC68B68